MVGSDLEPTLGTASMVELVSELKRRIDALDASYRTKKPNKITYEKVSADRPQAETTTHTFKE